jgi:hypothetical protein
MYKLIANKAEMRRNTKIALSSDEAAYPLLNLKSGGTWPEGEMFTVADDGHNLYYEFNINCDTANLSQ